MKRNTLYTIFYWVMAIAICLIICLDVEDRGYYVFVAIAIISFVLSYLTGRIRCGKCGKMINQKEQNFKYCPYCQSELDKNNE